MSRNRPGERSGPAPAEYHGFSGTWDSKARIFVFASKEERDRWQIHTYGQVRNAWRGPEEPDDGRVAIARDSCRCKACRERIGMWESEAERLAYETAVRLNPRLPDEGPMAYAKRVSQFVTQEYLPNVPVKRMPKAGRVRI